MPLMPIPLMAQQLPMEAMQVDEDNDNTQTSPLIVENPTIDLEVYACAYTGLARLYRLKFVADVCPSLRLEALKMAISYVTTTCNVPLYQALHKKLQDALNAQNGNAGGPGGANGGGGGGGGGLPDVAMPGGGAQGAHGGAAGQHQDLPVFDPNWVETNSKKAALKQEKLDADLKNYKSNSVKESIRRGHDDLGDHHTNCGDLANALKCYTRARDYCTSGKHVVQMCLNVIKVSLYLQNWNHVLSFVTKAENTPDYADTSKESNQAVQTCLKCAAGLAELQIKKYKAAAKHFLQAQFDHCDFPHLMSPNNVAMYGGLCALATFDRAELQKNVIGSASFKLFLELEPQLRDIICKFYESRYGQCLKLLDEIRDNLLLDMYIAPHLATLYTKIRNRALIQYFSPYLSADMHQMAAAFNRSVQALENELMQLILDGQIQARIDSHNKILYAKETDQRHITFERALLMGREYQRRARMLVLRAAMIKSQIHVKSVPRDAGGSHATELCAAAGSSNTPRN